MEASQEQLKAFTDLKMKDVQQELATLHEEMSIARRSHWNTKPIQRRLKREGQRLIFYRKIRAALEAGYYVVPNFMGDVFAIRTDARVPKNERVLGYVSLSDFRQRDKRLETGEGHYIAPRSSHRTAGEENVGTDEKPRWLKVSVPADLEPVDFPIDMLKPQVMDATSRAMALKVFDQMIQARDYASCGDPMILGRILNPMPSRPDVTFFVAWALPLERW
jgi:hypothetical protein